MQVVRNMHVGVEIKMTKRGFRRGNGGAMRKKRTVNGILIGAFI